MEIGAVDVLQLCTFRPVFTIVPESARNGSQGRRRVAKIRAAAVILKSNELFPVPRGNYVANAALAGCSRVNGIGWQHLKAAQLGAGVITIVLAE